MAINCTQCGQRNPDGVSNCMSCSSQIGPPKQSEDQKYKKWTTIAGIAVVVFLFFGFVLPILWQPEKLSVGTSEVKCEPAGFKDHKHYTDRGWVYDPATSSQSEVRQKNDPFHTGSGEDRVCFSRVITSEKPFAK